MRRLVKILCVSLLALLGGLFFLAAVALNVYFRLAMPESPVVDDSDLRLPEPAVPDDENAYVAFIAVTNQLDCSSEDKKVLSAYSMYCEGQSKPFSFWRKDGTPETCRAEVDRILSERAEGLKDLHQAVQRPKYRLIPDAGGLYFPPISAMCHAHRLLRAQADRAREHGDFSAAFSAERDAFLFAALCRDNASTLVECLAGNSLVKPSCRGMVMLANEEGVSDEFLTAMDELLKDDFDENALFEQTVKREYVNFTCWALDKIGETVSMDRLPLELPPEFATLRSFAVRISGASDFARFAYNKEMTRQDVADVYRAALAGRDVEELLPKPRNCFQPNFVGRIAAHCITPAFKGVRRDLKESLFVLRAARTAVAIRRYGRANGGEIPSDLSALVPTCLAEVPRDPFAPERALGYDAATRQLWTVGADGDFDALDAGKNAKSRFRHDREKCVFRLVGETPTQYDVLVVGAGPAGICAATAAGEAGARTLLVERDSIAGGATVTSEVNFPGTFHLWGGLQIDGCGWRLVTNAVALAGGTLPDPKLSDNPVEQWRYHIPVNAPLYAALAEEMVVKAGVKILYHTMPVSAVRQDGFWAVRLCCSGEMREVKARELVDATGNGTLAAMCGAKREIAPTGRQPGTFSYRFKIGADRHDVDWTKVRAAYDRAIADGSLQRLDTYSTGGFIPIKDFVYSGGRHAMYVPDADNSTADAATDTDMRGRASMLRIYRFLRGVPELGGVTLTGAAQQTGVRETYRVVGEHVLTAAEYLSGEVGADAICHGCYPVDRHDPADKLHRGFPPKGVVPKVPFGSLVPKGVDHLLVAGRCISSDRDANSAIRVQATCMATGQAAGVAAALAAKSGTTPYRLDLGAVKAVLRAQGAIVP